MQCFVLCPECGHSDFLAKFCTQCGTAMVPDCTIPRCFCGAPINEENKFCGECGRELLSQMFETARTYLLAQEEMKRRAS